MALDHLHGSFSDIGAHQDLQKPNLAIPELLIKERLTTYPCSEFASRDLSMGGCQAAPAIFS